MNRDVHPIEREWAYRQHLLFCLGVTALFGCLAPITCYFAWTDHGDGDLHGIRIPAAAAIPLRWCTAILMGAMLVLSVVMLWQRLGAPHTRIALTRDGILLPRNRWTTKEELSRFEEVREWSFSRYRGHVTFLHLHTPRGTFSIARQMLTQADFDEITAVVTGRIRDAGGALRP